MDKDEKMVRPTSSAISGEVVVVVGVSFPIFWCKIVAIRPGKKLTPFLKKKLITENNCGYFGRVFYIDGLSCS